MLNKKTLFSICLLFIMPVISNFAQGVAISEDMQEPHQSSILDIISTDKGLLLPRMTTAQRDAIDSPAESLIIFNNDNNCFETYIFDQWQSIWCAEEDCVESTAPTSISGTTTICVGDNTVLTVQGGSLGDGASWEWYTGSCGGVSAGSGANIDVSPTENTTYYVRAEGDCNVTDCAEIEVTVNPLPETPTSVTATETTICEGESTDLQYTGGSGNSFEWFTISCGGTPAGSGQNNTVSPTETTTYYGRWENDCGESNCESIIVSVEDCSDLCGDPLIINHTIGNVAPENKTVTYDIVQYDGKCWITKNLGASNQASSAADGSDAAAGWYWQFNRKQGYAVGPNPAWTITEIDENSDWQTANDPCAIELGAEWRVPTNAEWESASDEWEDYNDTFNSVLKIHASGTLYYSDGSLFMRGANGWYWSSTQFGNKTARWLSLSSTYAYIHSGDWKAFAQTIRCVKNL